MTAKITHSNLSSISQRILFNAVWSSWGTEGCSQDDGRPLVLATFPIGPVVQEPNFWEILKFELGSKKLRDKDKEQQTCLLQTEIGIFSQRQRWKQTRYVREGNGYSTKTIWKLQDVTESQSRLRISSPEEMLLGHRWGHNELQPFHLHLDQSLYRSLQWRKETTGGEDATWNTYSNAGLGLYMQYGAHQNPRATKYCRIQMLVNFVMIKLYGIRFAIKAKASTIPIIMHHLETDGIPTNRRTKPRQNTFIAGLLGTRSSTVEYDVIGLVL